MLMVNKKLMKQAQQFVTMNSKSKAIDLLLANGCDLQAASEIVNNFYKSENYADQYIVEHLQELLPRQKAQAAKIVMEYYEISIEFSRKLVNRLVDKGDFTASSILQTLRELEPRRRPDYSRPNQGAALSYQGQLLQHLSEGRESLCVDMLMNDLKLEIEEANDYLDELKTNLRRAE